MDWDIHSSMGGLQKILKREECPYKERCYRKNPHHFRVFEHPFLMKKVPTEMKSEASGSKSPSKITGNTSRKRKITAFSSSDEDKLAVPELKKAYSPGTMLERLQKNFPYNLFFTTIQEIPETLGAPNAVSFPDLLCPSLGNLKCSLQINFIIDIDWLWKQYKEKNLDEKPLTILYGEDRPDMAEYINRFCPNVKHHLVKMRDQFGCHHSKVGIYVYEDCSVRVVVSTANLYREDWNNYHQGLWISPRCPKLPEGSTLQDGESPTGFKADLYNYLKTYNLGILREWLDYVKDADFSEIKVALVYSAPGKYYPKRNGNHLHRVGELLSRHCSLPEKTSAQSEGPLSWGIIAQASSIGSIGKSAAEWLRGSLLRSLASHKKGKPSETSQATISFVYPSGDNVAHGCFGQESGGCLSYSRATDEKQKWLQTYMHQWIADTNHRTKAMPHTKFYCRVSPCLRKLAFFMLTSANLSKAAWGNNIQKDGGSYVRSYEVGVMFLPEFFEEEYFEIRNTTERKNKTLFPFIFDLPLTSFKRDDYPWYHK